MTNKPTNISTEDLLLILQQKAKTAIALATAEKTTSDYKMSEADYRTILVGIYYKYGLNQNDKINDSTGEILYTPAPTVQGEVTEPVQPEAEASESAVEPVTAEVE